MEGKLGFLYGIGTNDMCCIIGYVYVLVSKKPTSISDTFANKFGHACEDAKGREFWVVWFSHGDFPKPT